MADELVGGCQCGAVRYVARPSTSFRSYACHCTLCQSQTGSAFALHLWLLEGDLHVTGACIEGRQAKPDGTTLSVYGCPHCLSRVYSVDSARLKVLTLRLGTLDDSAGIIPEVHIWTRSKQPWIVLPEGAPTLEMQGETLRELLRLMRR